MDDFYYNWLKGNIVKRRVILGSLYHSLYIIFGEWNEFGEYLRDITEKTILQGEKTKFKNLMPLSLSGDESKSRKLGISGLDLNGGLQRLFLEQKKLSFLGFYSDWRPGAVWCAASSRHVGKLEWALRHHRGPDAQNIKLYLEESTVRWPDAQNIKLYVEESTVHWGPDAQNIKLYLEESTVHGGPDAQNSKLYLEASSVHRYGTVLTSKMERFSFCVLH